MCGVFIVAYAHICVYTRTDDGPPIEHILPMYEAYVSVAWLLGGLWQSLMIQTSYSNALLFLATMFARQCSRGFLEQFSRRAQANDKQGGEGCTYVGDTIEQKC